MTRFDPPRMASTHDSRRRFLQVAATGAALGVAGCIHDGDGGGDDAMDGGPMEAMDPAEAPRATVDRFSEDAGTLMVRSPDNDLPGPDEPIDFDAGAPFLTMGLGPDGEHVSYYNFDVQPTAPAPIWALFHEDGSPVEDQLNVVDAIPGDEDYNDFWHVHKVTVPDDYVPNTATSRQDIVDAGYPVEETEMLVNCPVVPEGSSASMRHGDGDPGLVEGWYRGEVVSYFQFTEASLSPTGDGAVPLSPIYVAFNTNPGQEDGGAASGFVTEEDSHRTHNVVQTLPGDAGYSPLWQVNVYDNADFDAVEDLASAQDANVLARGVANVNCPIVSISDAMEASMDGGSMEDDGAMMEENGSMDGGSMEQDGSMDG